MRWFWALCLMMAGCSTPVDPRPTGSDELVLRVVDTGGLLAPGWEFRLPSLSLYGDGLLVMPGDLAAAPVRRRLSVEGVRRVVRAAVNAGLAKEQDYGSPQILDAPVSIFTLVSGKPYVTKVVAPFELSGFDPAQSEARRRVHTFRKALNDLDSWLGDEIGPVDPPAPGPQVIFAYRASGQANVAEWPYSDLMTAGQEHGVGRCLVLSADQARPLGQRTSWRSGEKVFQLVTRPLLPDEKSCADIKPLR